VPVTGGDLNREYGKSSRAYLKSWDASQATVEIVTQGPKDESSIVGLSLKENLIHYRVEHLESGARKYFVHPEDEARACEIICEIKAGDPPT
jgi:hypothetical protein